MRDLGHMPRAAAMIASAMILASTNIHLAAGAALPQRDAAPAADRLLNRVTDQRRSDAPPEPKVTREQAAAIAVKAVPGEVTSVDLEPKQGRLVYVVEIMPPGGAETDVLVDIDSGEVLGTE
ncbi:MAG TPA: PepSY domain-containing protein [Crenalkalicoccus sp.]|jgi:uncharacterized membrane protein YkoI|nr:PepSY domain-containing protein [Crenalkalicoccus sp.]